MTTILVVDDEPVILRTVQAGLVARGYEVETASSGREALYLLTARTPDAVLLDLALGDMDGLDVCRAVRSWSDVTIIVLSAEGLEHRKVVALDEGDDDDMTKPFSMPELLARVRVALRHRADPRGADDPVLVCGELEIDLARHVVTHAGGAIELAEGVRNARCARPPPRPRLDPSHDFCTRCGVPDTTPRPSTDGSTRVRFGRSSARRVVPCSWPNPVSDTAWSTRLTREPVSRCPRRRPPILRPSPVKPGEDRRR